MDFSGVPVKAVEKHGEEKVAEIIGCAPASLKRKLSLNAFTIRDLQAIANFDAELLAMPAAAPEVKIEAERPLGTRLAVILPSNRGPRQITMDTIMRMYDPSKMQKLRNLHFNNIHTIRNVMAARFLESPCEWSWWSDDDMIHPCGDVGLLRSVAGMEDYPEPFASLNSILRLHGTGHKLVGAMYVSKTDRANPQCSGGRYMLDELRRGPSWRTLPQDWIGFGSALVHRDVFLDIAKQQPDVVEKNTTLQSIFNYKYSFFGPTEASSGDDIAFCYRAKAAGHQPHVDLALMPGHIGECAYTYKDIRRAV